MTRYIYSQKRSFQIAAELFKYHIACQHYTKKTWIYWKAFFKSLKYSNRRWLKSSFKIIIFVEYQQNRLCLFVGKKLCILWKNNIFCIDASLRKLPFLNCLTISINRNSLLLFVFWFYIQDIKINLNLCWMPYQNNFVLLKDEMCYNY